ncbi:type I restriction-modification system endonuclease subunit beta [Anoxybacillus gonensis]|uniref:Type II restriction enzyme BslI subunit beta n=1 Tax=Bacillus sp. (strain NEB-606) TaxID=114630 RepID=T2BLB_BACSQ|nr:type I restriction-modification system endonuclease subunit beta [Anoxybacillus gonensis]Q9LAI0.1 RecName: Full=Type II restriction enzyme BslI subunit beta; Short=R.BslIbeta; AltName: Full=Endonuclease BslI subunit beta; AltName: Full=Type IIT restriction enzyme BslI subunit beta; AltName: Full=Type-2 restriction enzyme BslI subunit beta [Bacillus sp. NEB-606]AAF32531.1 BslIRbeta [Bacillus sp. NEB-606]EMI09201.1 Type IIT restriction enzyme BslI subunit beta [Anoxybacillus gonensis]
MEQQKFPNPRIFEDIDATDFSKHNKKHVTEDFVAENFKDVGWRVYRPFNDTGIDLIAKKFVCPDGHTKWNQNLTKEMTCSECGKSLIEITRFIQVKTREVKQVKTREAKGEKFFFGYTLKSKDFRTDPRHVFLLYSDFTMDFIILPMYDYLNLFYTNQSLGSTHFSTPSFRQGNNKLNGLSKDKNDNWVWSGVSFNEFVNEKGMDKLSCPIYDIELESYTKKIQELKFSLFYRYSPGRKNQVSAPTVEFINNHFSIFISLPKEAIASKRKAHLESLRQDLPEDLKKSVNEGYLVKFKGVDL